MFSQRPVKRHLYLLWRFHLLNDKLPSPGDIPSHLRHYRALPGHLAVPDVILDVDMESIATPTLTLHVFDGSTNATTFRSIVLLSDLIGYIAHSVECIYLTLECIVCIERVSTSKVDSMLSDVRELISRHVCYITYRSLQTTPLIPGTK